MTDKSSFKSKITNRPVRSRISKEAEGHYSQGHRRGAEDESIRGLHGKRIAVCDGAGTTINHVRRILSYVGATVVGETRKPPELLEIAQTDHPDFVLIGESPELWL